VQKHNGDNSQKGEERGTDRSFDDLETGNRYVSGCHGSNA